MFKVQSRITTWLKEELRPEAEIRVWGMSWLSLALCYTERPAENSPCYYNSVWMWDSEHGLTWSSAQGLNRLARLTGAAQSYLSLVFPDSLIVGRIQFLIAICCQYLQRLSGYLSDFRHDPAPSKWMNPSQGNPTWINSRLKTNYYWKIWVI